LKDGEIVERGHHDELLAHGGQYAEIYQLQLADQERVRREIADFSRLKRATDKGSTDEQRTLIEQEASGD